MRLLALDVYHMKIATETEKTTTQLMKSELTLLVVVFSRRSGRGQILDLPPGLFGGLEGSQLVFLLVNPGGGEASIVLGQTGGSR